MSDFDDDTSYALTLENLKRARQELSERLLEMSQKPRPSYEIDGQKFSRTEYQRYLKDAIEGLSQLIIDMEGPFQFETQAVC